MAAKVLARAIRMFIFCSLLPCLYGDGLPGYVPLNGAKVGVPITPPGLASVDPQVIEDGEMIETAASDLESEASLEEWEDENQDDGETASFVGRMSRAPTYIDVMLGRVTKYGGLVHPADIGLSIIPTGLQSPLNHTELKATNMTEKTRKIMCVGRNMTENETAIVRIVNNTELLSTLMLKNDSLQPNCAIVMFYAPWCMFSARTAPHFNALARAFPQIDVLAIDAIHFSNLNARFGTIAVPNILLFHNSKAVARFNVTKRTFDHLAEFVSNITGLDPVPNITVEPWDYEGPLPGTPTQESDYLLLVCWAFILGVCYSMFQKSAVGQRLLQSFANFGREPVAANPH